MDHIQLLRLYYGSIDGPVGNLPIHGYAIKHPKGVILVDTGMGRAPEPWPREWKLTLRAAADALADHDLSPVDVSYVLHTHLHTDHCGENIVFKHTPVLVQRTELERARREHPHLADRFDYVGAKFELLDGDVEVLPGVKTIFTPGHTSGHQSVLIGTESPELIIGDAAYTLDIWERPDELEGPARERQIQGDANDWRGSLELLRRLQPDVGRLHFCHDPRILAGGRSRGEGT
jgi:N-acyl homoserine lactone hydrolase